jgi:hypothetical protein
MSEVVSSVPSAALRRAVRTAIVAVVAISFVSVEANAYSKKVENACRGDYNMHCPGYKVGSPALRSCITLAGKRGNLSKQCFDALADAGMVPRKYLKNR